MTQDRIISEDRNYYKEMLGSLILITLGGKRKVKNAKIGFDVERVIGEVKQLLRDKSITEIARRFNKGDKSDVYEDLEIKLFKLCVAYNSDIDLQKRLAKISWTRDKNIDNRKMLIKIYNLVMKKLDEKYPDRKSEIKKEKEYKKVIEHFEKGTFDLLKVLFNHYCIEIESLIESNWREFMFSLVHNAESNFKAFSACIKHRRDRGRLYILARMIISTCEILGAELVGSYLSKVSGDKQEFEKMICSLYDKMNIVSEIIEERDGIRPKGVYEPSVRVLGLSEVNISISNKRIVANTMYVKDIFKENKESFINTIRRGLN